MATFGAILLAVGLGLVNGWNWGYDRGKARADRAHAACHEAQRAVRDQFLKMVSEHADMQAWEEEL